MSEYAKNIQTIEDMWKKRIELRDVGGRMSEYIICPHCYNPLSQSEYVKVVRCKNCKYARKTDAGMDCDRHILCARFNPNGFCAWGERQEP